MLRVATLCNLGFTICGSYIEQVWPPLVYRHVTGSFLSFYPLRSLMLRGLERSWSV